MGFDCSGSSGRRGEEGERQGRRERRGERESREAGRSAEDKDMCVAVGCDKIRLDLDLREKRKPDHTRDAPKVCCAMANILHLEPQIAVAHVVAMRHRWAITRRTKMVVRHG